MSSKSDIFWNYANFFVNKIIHVRREFYDTENFGNLNIFLVNFTV